MLLPAEQPVDRLAKMFAFEIPQRHVDGGHRRDRDRRAAKVHRLAMHLLPQPVGLQRILADQDFSQPASNVVAERRVDNRLDDLWLRIRFADAFQAVVGADPHQHGVLAAGGFLLHRRNAKQLADDILDFHRTGCGFNVKEERRTNPLLFLATHSVSRKGPDASTRVGIKLSHDQGSRKWRFADCNGILLTCQRNSSLML